MSADINLFAGWIGMLAGVISGAIIGMNFHKDSWMGGYGSFSRRLTRLGHISFFGLAFINLLYGFTLNQINISITYISVASISFIVGAVTMPICCFLAAWKKIFVYLFPIPVLAVLTGILIVVFGWPIK